MRVPADRKVASSFSIVLIGLTNHAGPDGRNRSRCCAVTDLMDRLDADGYPAASSRTGRVTPAWKLK
jgi:hypothetical protein